MKDQIDNFSKMPIIQSEIERYQTMKEIVPANKLRTQNNMDSLNCSPSITTNTLGTLK